jgi:hypothetical protein
MKKALVIMFLAATGFILNMHCLEGKPFVICGYLSLGTLCIGIVVGWIRVAELSPSIYIGGQQSCQSRDRERNSQG